MDQVEEHGIEELHDVGACRQHNRIFECYCNQCNILICPSCLMFDTHKGHSVSPIEEGSRMIRESITQCSREGILKFERTQNFLLDIRHGKLTVEENKNKVIQEAENAFDLLIQVLKQRKTSLVQELRQHNDKEIQKLQEKEEKWILKQEKAEKVLEHQKSKDELRLIENAKFIIETLSDLRVPGEKHTISLVGKLNTNLVIGSHTVTIEELTELLRNFIKWQVSATNEIKT